MLVEFFGVPGCGKSTLADFVLQELTKAGVRSSPLSTARLQAAGNRARACGRTLLKITRCLAAMICSPTRGVLLIHCVLATRQQSFRQAFKVLVNLLELSRLCRARRRSDLVLMDQGVYQALWSVAWSAQHSDPAIYRRLLALLPKPDAVVAIAIAAGAIGRRLDDRREPHSRLDQARDGDPDAITRAISCAAIVGKLLEEPNAPAVLAVDNNGELAALHGSAVRLAHELAALRDEKERQTVGLPISSNQIGNA